MTLSLPHLQHQYIKYMMLCYSACMILYSDGCDHPSQPLNIIALGLPHLPRPDMIVCYSACTTQHSDGCEHPF